MNLALILHYFTTLYSHFPEIVQLWNRIKEELDKDFILCEDILWRKFELNGKIYPSVMVPCLLYTSPSPRDATLSRMPSSA